MKIDMKVSSLSKLYNCFYKPVEVICQFKKLKSEKVRIGEYKLT